VELQGTRETRDSRVRLGSLELKEKQEPEEMMEQMDRQVTRDNKDPRELQDLKALPDLLVVQDLTDNQVPVVMPVILAQLELPALMEPQGRLDRLATLDP